MRKRLEEEINDEKNGREIRLSGKLELDVTQEETFTIGRVYVKGLIEIKRSNIIIDGSDAEIEVNIEDCTTSDWSLFFIHPLAKNVQLRNLHVKVKVLNATNSTRMFSLVYNLAHHLKLHNCDFELYSEKQLNMAIVYNNGNLDTHLETRADSLVIEDSFFRVQCFTGSYEKECSVYGIYNYFANSISVQNTVIYAMNVGNGGRQKAVGIFTNGRFGRFVGNNIKANGSHSIGREKEQAHAFGFINEGLYSIITSNNIIGEWGGVSVALENRESYAIMSSNKMLATHTICGRSLRNYGNNSTIENNVLISTSRNARMLEHTGNNCIISRNIMEILMVDSECRSGCGIYAAGENCTENIISENIIRNVVDCAIFADESVGIVVNNQITCYAGTINRAGNNDVYVKDKIDERNIQSIYE